MSGVFTTAQAAEQMKAPSERWLVGQLRAGRFPGRKVGRHWVMTAEDIDAALNVCANDGLRNVVDTPSAGLAPRSKRLVRARYLDSRDAP